MDGVASTAVTNTNTKQHNIT